jgi:hypothetical protein
MQQGEKNHLLRQQLWLAMEWTSLFRPTIIFNINERTAESLGRIARAKIWLKSGSLNPVEEEGVWFAISGNYVWANDNAMMELVVGWSVDDSDFSAIVFTILFSFQSEVAGRFLLREPH